ncbi:ankyrin repeat domain-containing protein [Streptomyces sp. NPDC051582]|uniref:ankyrin repeat domain-containing protein n=1 Tax=Streptomyces sp. NPDC051582 TaxID=3155167 RepID=UPI003431B8E1
MSPHPHPELDELPGGFRTEDGPAWQRIRRHAVPGWMIERATAHRLAGDWRAACAAAAVDLVFDLPGLAARHGAPVAEAVEEDLRHLAPDLVRWHLPRVLGGRTTLDPDVRVLLARYGSGAGAPVLSVTTGSMIEGPQRLRLDCGPLATPRRTYSLVPQPRAEDWTAARPLWDARHGAALRERLGGGAGRLPFFAPDGTPLRPDELPACDPGVADPAGHAEWIALLGVRDEGAAAYEAAGLERDETAPRPSRYGRPFDPGAFLLSADIDLTRLASELRRLAESGAGQRWLIGSFYPHALLEPTGPGPADRIRVRVVEREEAKGVPLLPRFAWKRQPDLELVRTGRIAPRELHPLVSAALFPGAGPADGPPGPAGAKPVRVRCRGEWHEVRSRDGVLDLLPHSREEQQRERAMRAFGGAIQGCFAVQQIWTTGEGRLPRALREERRELFLRVQHGDTPGVVALLDAGTDPRVRDGRGRTLLHELHLLDHEELLPRLLAAGLDLEARTKTGLTPLQIAVQCGGSAELVRAYLAAGSRIDVVDDAELSLAQVVRRYRRADLAFLRARVEEEFPDIGSEWFDEYMEEREAEEEGEDA